MRVLAFVVALSTLVASAQVVKRDPPFVDQLHETETLARQLSAKGDYAGAAELFAKLLTKWNHEVDDSEFDKAFAERAKASYERRSALAVAASTEARAGRDLLLELLTPSIGLRAEQASSDDSRIASLLTQLKKTDPRARRFFDGRAVKVTVQGDVGEPLQQGVMGAVVDALRDFGFAAGAKGGDEVVVTVHTGEVIDASSLARGMVSCQLVIGATWTSASKRLFSVDLSRRGVGHADLLDRCYVDRVRDVRTRSAALVFKAWDAL